MILHSVPSYIVQGLLFHFQKIQPLNPVLCVCLTFCPIPEAYLGDGCWDHKCFVIHFQAQSFLICIEKVLIQIAATLQNLPIYIHLYFCIVLALAGDGVF